MTTPPREHHHAGRTPDLRGVSGSPGNVHALRHAADLAHQHDAILIPLLAWVPPGGNLNERKDPSPQLRQLWEDQARQRLWGTLDTAFGGLPTGIVTEPVVLRGKPGRALTLVARQPGDMLVIGPGAGARCGSGPNQQQSVAYSAPSNG